ncbi:MAG TPA: cupin domain-containing protein [Rugosimonospora sp.]|nr:cupin domain-containing protein [Rugosimonospora sp.]
MSENIPVKVSAAGVAPNRKRGGDIRVLLSPKTVGATAGFTGVLTLAPGEYVTEHYHPYSEEFLYVVRGLLVMRINGTEVELAPGDSLMVPIGMRHRAENRGGETVEAVFHLGPLAPRPDLGHVDTERPVLATSNPEVG